MTTLVCQDWGGLIGLRLFGEHPDRFARVVAANTFLPTGDGTPSEAFLGWLTFSQEVETFPTGTIVNLGCATDLAPEVIAGYDAPFPDQSYTEGARQFPTLVPISSDDPASAANRAAWKVLETFDKPFLTAFSDGDPITAGGDRALQARIPGAKGRDHVTIVGGGHFLQEDRGPSSRSSSVRHLSTPRPGWRRRFPGTIRHLEASLGGRGPPVATRSEPTWRRWGGPRAGDAAPETGKYGAWPVGPAIDIGGPAVAHRVRPSTRTSERYWLQ